MCQSAPLGKRTPFRLHPQSLILAMLLIGYGWYFKSRVNQSDFLVFYGAAKSILHGQSPYPAVGSHAVYSGSSFVYPYVTALLFLPFAVLSAQNAEYVYVVLSILAIVYSLLIVGVRRVSVLVLFMLASATIVSWQMGTLNPFFMLGIALAWRYRDKAVLAGTLVALVTFAKLFLLPLLIWLLIARRTKALLVALGELASLCVLTFSIGPLSLASYSSLLGSLATHEGSAGYSTLSLLRAAGVGQSFSEVLVLAIGAMLAFRMYIRFGLEKRESILVSESLVIALVITPILWSSYLTLFGLACIFAWRSSWAIAGYAIFSWLVLTPDRAGMPVVVISFIAVVVLVLLQLHERDKTPFPSGLFPPGDRTFLSCPKMRTALSMSVILMLLTAVIQLKFEPAMLVQISLLLLFPASLVCEQPWSRDLESGLFG